MKLILILSFVAFSFVIYSQKSRKKFADKMFYSMMYKDAAEAYEDVLERTNDSLSVLPNIGRSYHKLGQTQKAVQWLDYMNQNGTMQADDLLQLAFMKRELSDYKGFNDIIDEYVDKYGETEFITAIQNQIVDFEKLDAKEDHFTLTPINVPEEFSFLSINYNSNDSIFISSTKNTFSLIQRIDGWTGGNYYSLGIAKLDEQQNLSEINPLLFKKRKLLHKTSLCIDPENKYVYFTANNFKRKKGNINTLKIFRGRLQHNEIIEIEPLSINDNYYSCAYPSISSDGKTLYFASNMPGGYGGMDIYAASIQDDKTLGKPINLGGLINSPRNEITPHILSEDKRLFFSTNGHIGFGGYDVFVAHLSSVDGVTKIENLGKSINTNKDEISFVNSKDQTEGFLISNRDNQDKPFKLKQSYAYSPMILKGAISNIEGSRLPNIPINFLNKHGDTILRAKSDENGLYEAQFNNHLYETIITVNKSNHYNEKQINLSFQENQKLIEKNLTLHYNTDISFSGVITDKENMATLEGVNIKVKNLVADFASQQTYSKTDGSFNINYEDIGDFNGLQFKMTLDKKGYSSKTFIIKDLDTEDRIISLNDNFDLSLVKSSFHSNNLKDIININNVLFGFDRKDLSSSYKKELDKIVKFMKENPNVKLLIEGHTDTRGPKEYNDKLSLKRASTCFNYLLSQGVDNDRLSIKALGETNPIHSDQVISQQTSTADKNKLHAENRRTEFYISE